MNFAPYQDASPETHRALSPPLPASSSSPRVTSPNIGTLAASGPQKLPSPSTFDRQGKGFGVGGGGGVGGRRTDMDVFETRLGIRMDWEACAAYLLLPPAGAVLLLVLEQRSDYVRFHAWQSSLLFTFLFVMHIIFSWSSFLSWLLFVCDLGLIGYLTMRAYRDADTLDRCEVPFFGPLASSILDDE
ncbi:hypothetical protein W97_04117 [Coniosporium apollinis CBS 100218]|uniref:Uncharacterized protein n=1 Tax=Coniosporium apollinis (strain CBS 100218) TaxID=1168221 RepID=R7YSR4_CONA1|nr:uncharacterized protein W97_04117 [Coniosporium apollinis CBS 100218]EON64883.1 hypothetical protein W97_04117 [Coniosporium apollinis CBS 100218]